MSVIYVLVVTLLAMPAAYDGRERALKPSLVEVGEHQYASRSIGKVREDKATLRKTMGERIATLSTRKK